MSPTMRGRAMSSVGRCGAAKHMAAVSTRGGGAARLLRRFGAEEHGGVRKGSAVVGAGHLRCFRKTLVAKPWQPSQKFVEGV